MVENARNLLPDKMIRVASITFQKENKKGIPHDSRQNALLGASWSAGSLKYLMEHGVTSATYFETYGAGGLFQEKLFPMYHVFADVTELRGGHVIPSRSSAPLLFDSLVLVKGNHMRILLVSYSKARQTISIPFIKENVTIRMLDEESVAFAVSHPNEFRKKVYQHQSEGEGGSLTLLPPRYLKIHSRFWLSMMN